MYTELFTKTLEHQLAQVGCIEMIPAAWVKDIANPAPSCTTSLRRHDDTELVDMTGLWNSLCREGLRDPLMIVAEIGSERCRLQEGNHRIGVLIENGITHVPSALFMADHIRTDQDGLRHCFDRTRLSCDFEQRFVQWDNEIFLPPSDCFLDLHAAKTAGRVCSFNEMNLQDLSAA